MQTSNTTGIPSGMPDKTGMPERDLPPINITEKAAASMEGMSSTLSSSGHQAVDRMAGAMSAAAKTLSERGQDLMAAQKRLTEASCETVRRHPIASVAVALAAGVLISRLTSHSSADTHH